MRLFARASECRLCCLTVVGVGLQRNVNCSKQMSESVTGFSVLIMTMVIFFLKREGVHFFGTFLRERLSLI